MPGGRRSSGPRRATGSMSSAPPSDPHTVDMWAYHTLRHLLAGVLDASRVHQVNVRWLASEG